MECLRCSASGISAVLVLLVVRILLLAELQRSHDVWIYIFGGHTINTRIYHTSYRGSHPSCAGDSSVWSCGRAPFSIQPVIRLFMYLLTAVVCIIRNASYELVLLLQVTSACSLVYRLRKQKTGRFGIVIIHRRSKTITN